jgi:hypothetical protein
MRVTFLGNFGVDYSSETHHKKSLEALGHEVIALQETQVGSDQVLAEASKSDMFVWVHTHGWQTPGTIPMRRVLQRLRSNGIPTVTYHLDLWLGLARQNDLRRDSVYTDIEWFFTVDKKMAEWFNANTRVKGRYLPAGVFHEEMFIDSNIQKVNDIMFVGSKGYHPEWPYRPKLIDWLQQTYGDRFRHVGGDGTGVVRGHALTGLYNATKVVVGDSLVKDFNYPYYWSDRLYETLGRGGFMIFPQIKGIQDEFSTYDFKVDDGMFWDKPAAPVELVTYEFGNFDMLKQRIDYYLEHDKEREEIRKNGFERVKNNYTYKHRWQTILKEIGLE